MFIHFKSINAVLTCESFPRVISVEDMKLNDLESLCNIWEKNDNEDGTFTLSFKYKEDNWYLQNSGNMDILCVKLTDKFCNLCEVDGYPNVYKWFKIKHDEHIFALHVKNNKLSDADVSKEINNIKEHCEIEFSEHI